MYSSEDWLNLESGIVVGMLLIRFIRRAFRYAGPQTIKQACQACGAFSDPQFARPWVDPELCASTGRDCRWPYRGSPDTIPVMVLIGVPDISNGGCL